MLLIEVSLSLGDGSCILDFNELSKLKWDRLEGLIMERSIMG